MIFYKQFSYLILSVVIFFEKLKVNEIYFKRERVLLKGTLHENEISNYNFMYLFYNDWM